MERRTAKVESIVDGLFRRYLVVKVSLIVLVAVVLGFSISAVVSARM